MIENTLFIIPARGGSKGIPRKNIKLLNGKPLIEYTLDVARQLAKAEDICVTTDDIKIKALVERTGLPVPFLRPPELATDITGTYEVLIHALNYYESQGRNYEKLVLLQPTSPFRQVQQVKAVLDSWQPGIEMIVSVKETKSNPYYLLFEENSDGYLEKSKKGNFKTRQDCPKVYEYNGAIYLIDIQSLRRRSISEFEKIKKYVMDEESSLDIDTSLDWKFAQYILKERRL